MRFHQSELTFPRAVKSCPRARAILAATAEHYAHPHRPSIAQVYQQCIYETARVNADLRSGEVRLPYVSRSAFYRFIKALDPFCVTSARWGFNEAMREFRNECLQNRYQHPTHFSLRKTTMCAMNGGDNPEPTSPNFTGVTTD